MRSRHYILSLLIGLTVAASLRLDDAIYAVFGMPGLALGIALIAAATIAVAAILSAFESVIAAAEVDGFGKPVIGRAFNRRVVWRGLSDWSVGHWNRRERGSLGGYGTDPVTGEWRAIPPSPAIVVDGPGCALGPIEIIGPAAR